jgi:probable F420-dependent oxidoreductase
MSSRAFRFGIGPAGLHGHEPQSTGRGWAELCMRIEDLGYDAINVGDHLDDRLGPLAALMAAGCATSRLHLGVFMLSNDYRHPAILAKELATIDALSAGRLEVGLGAGWLAADYERAGLVFDPPGRRVDRLAESVQVIKRLLEGGECHFAGEHYRLDGLAGLPQPARRPRPPIALGGGGRRVLSMAGREADIIAFNVNLGHGVMGAAPGETATAAATDQKVEWVREAAGDRFSDLELQVFVHVVEVTTDRLGAAERLSPRLGISSTQVLDSPHVLLGTVDQIEETLEERRSRFGLSYVSVSATVLDDLAPVVERLTGR